MSTDEGRSCAQCAEPIPAMRLAAIPSASHCVTCLTIAGDVPLLKRHDDYVGKEGEDVVYTYYKKPTPYIKRYIDRLTQVMGGGFQMQEAF